MNCHGNDDRIHDVKEGKGAHGGHSGIGHMLMMAACCGLPILLLSLLPFLSGIPGVGSISRYVYLICPILMIPMMFMMMRSGRAKDRDDGQMDIGIQIRR